MDRKLTLIKRASAWARKRLIDPNEAEDVAHEAITKAKTWFQWTPLTTLWLMGTVRRYNRRTERRREAEAGYVSKRRSTYAADGAREVPTNEEAGPCAQALRQIRDAELPLNQARILEMRAMGHPITEIAEALGMPRTTVQRIHDQAKRAMER